MLELHLLLAIAIQPVLLVVVMGFSPGAGLVTEKNEGMARVGRAVKEVGGAESIEM